MAASKSKGVLSWTKISPGVYHATSPHGLYTIDGNNYGRNRWTVTYPGGDYGMADALAEAKLWAEQDAEQRSSRSSHSTKRSLFPSARERTEQYLAEGGFHKLYSGLTKRKEPFEIYGADNGSYSIHLSEDLKEIGTAYLASKWSDEGIHQGHADYISIVRIDPAYKRQGIATALYKAIERHTGRPLRPSPTDQSDEAKAFWAARTRRAHAKLEQPWERERRDRRDKARSISDDQLRELLAWAEDLMRQSGGYAKGNRIARETRMALGQERAYAGSSREILRAKAADTYQREIASKR